MINQQAIFQIRELYVRVSSAKNLLYEGKHVLAYNKLQGVLAKCELIYNILAQEIKDDMVIPLKEEEQLDNTDPPV